MKVLCVNNEQKVYNLLKIYFGGKMFESLKMAKCCLVFVTILTAMIMVPWSEGKTLFMKIKMDIPFQNLSRKIPIMKS